MGRGQTVRYIYIDKLTLQLLDQIDLVGRFGENCESADSSNMWLSLENLVYCVKHKIGVGLGRLLLEGHKYPGQTILLIKSI